MRRRRTIPTRPIKAITTTSAGGLSDLFMRALGDELHKRLGQPLIVENRPGGAMNVGTRACTEAAPDGYTICITNADAMVYNQFLFKKLPFDPETQLQPITNAFHLIHMLVVNSDLKVKNINELVALSKAKPGIMNYQAPGAPMVLYMETLKKEQGADWVRVPFRGGGEAVNAILSGTTPIGLFGEGNVIGQIRAGKMTPLVMLNNIRSPNFPEVPLLTEVGYNGAALAQLVWDFHPGRHAEADRRQARQGDRRHHIRPGLPRASLDGPQPGVGGQLARAVRRRDQAGPRGGEAGRAGRRLRTAVTGEWSCGTGCYCWWSPPASGR